MVYTTLESKFKTRMWMKKYIVSKKIEILDNYLTACVLFVHFIFAKWIWSTDGPTHQVDWPSKMVQSARTKNLFFPFVRFKLFECSSEYDMSHHWHNSKHVAQEKHLLIKFLLSIHYRKKENQMRKREGEKEAAQRTEKNETRWRGWKKHIK